jgi:glycine/D-amino acid oxidase-like deaminating enzyme
VRLHGRTEIDPAVAQQAHRDMLRFFPSLEGRRVEHAWGGPIDVSPTHIPMVVSMPGGRAWSAFGYTGNGVGPSRLAGRVLASLALERRDDHARLPILDPEGPAIPPEPFRYLGGELVRAAFLRRERLEEEGRSADPVTRGICELPRLLGVQLAR